MIVYNLPTFPDKDEALQDILENGGHILIAGTSGSGKSVLLNNLIYQALAFSPVKYQFILIDPKMVELQEYSGLEHCIAYSDNPNKTNYILSEVIKIMFNRLDEMKRAKIKKYQGNTLFIVVDELTDLMSNREAREMLVKISRLGRAANIRLMVCTQSPNRSKGGGLDPNLIANIHSKIALRCSTAIESRQILGKAGAENLPKYGTAIKWNSGYFTELKFGVVPEEKIKSIIEYWNNNKGVITD